MDKRLFVFALVLVTSASFSTAATLDVPGPQYPTIQSAIDAAVSGVDDVRVAPGTYFEDIDFLGKDIDVHSTDVNRPESTIIDGTGNGSVVTFHGCGLGAQLRGFTIQGGRAEYGGGIACFDSSPIISDCIIRDNQADFEGGGIDFDGSGGIILNCIIKNNYAAEGGAISCFDNSDPWFWSCRIVDNEADNAGGGIYCLYSSVMLRNCLLAGNIVHYGAGGAIYVWDSGFDLGNCTIADNLSLSNQYGGVYCDYLGNNDGSIINSILWNNGDDLYNCDGLVSYSCIEDADAGPGNIHQDPQLIIDPFVTVGPYFLKHKAAGQLVDSPCIDAGSADVDDPSIGLDLYSTRSDYEADVNRVDLGYHYEAGLRVRGFSLIVDADTVGGDGTITPHFPWPGVRVRQYNEYELFAEPNDPNYRIERWNVDGSDVLVDPGDPNSGFYQGQTYTITMNREHEVIVYFGTRPTYTLSYQLVPPGGAPVEPRRSGTYEYLEGTVVELIVQPDPCNVCVWSGTDNNFAFGPTNTVTMTGDKTVTVSFREPNDLYVGQGQYDTIGSAMHAALSGDTVIVMPGVYQEHNLDFAGKAITVASEYPDDPNVVANTIIDCQQRGRAFVLAHGEGQNSVIDGLTIINGSAVGNYSSPPRTGGQGGNGQYAYGGAIACFNGSSPTISNCIIKDCVARGQRGEDATYVWDAPGPPPAPPAPPPAPDPLQQAGPGEAGQPGIPGPNGVDGPNGVPGQPGYDGGDGGWGYGGALYFDPGSSPIIWNCTIINCGAVGGDGGFGGLGQDGQDGGDGGDGGDGQDGQAGGPAPEEGEPGAGGDGGDGGNGGRGGEGGRGGDGGKGGNGGNAYGGAIYFGQGCTPIIRYCKIKGCYARQGIGAEGGDAGAGGNGGNGGLAGEAGSGGAGEPDGEDGTPGTAGNGGNGGNGGRGGDSGVDGDESWGGAIYYEPNCISTVIETIISDSIAGFTESRQEYLAGDGGNGGAGGDGAEGDPAGAGGNGGNGGSTGNGGSARDPNFILFYAMPGAGGAGGAPDGSPGSSGMVSGGLPSHTSAYGGANFYDHECTVRLTDCTIAGSSAAAFIYSPNGLDMLGSNWEGEGGGEYYSSLCTVTVEDCELTRNTVGHGGDGGGQFFLSQAVLGADRSSFTYNVADGSGGGQYFGSGSTADVNDCEFAHNSAADGSGGGQFFLDSSTVGLDRIAYNRNSSTDHGGGLYCWYGSSLRVDDCIFAGNRATGTDGSGGGLHFGEVDNGSVELVINNTQFLSNYANFGGGLYWHGDAAAVSVADCVFKDNSAEHGGGLSWHRGAPTITGCHISGNEARGRFISAINGEQFGSEFYGGGGGLFCVTSDALIESCFVTGNTSSGSGGGMYLGGGASTPLVKNCLVKGNSAVLDGGGIASYWRASPTITNCTIVYNKVIDRLDSNHGRGGGLGCSYESQTNLRNSILWGNDGTNGKQIAIGSDADPIYLQRPAELTVRNCDIEGGQSAEAVYVEPGRTLNWPAGNIDADPLFVDGYFLSQILSGQGQDSPCVNAGFGSAADEGLAEFTTRTDGQVDTGTVDMGLHYPGGAANLYQLTVTVVGGHGTVEPSTGFFRKYSVVELAANPEPSYTIKQWTGTDNDLSRKLTNTVTIYGDTNVVVEFGKVVTIKVPADYPTVAEAVANARDGDLVVLAPIVHSVSATEGIDFEGKRITLTSQDPNNPTIVAATVIDCNGDRYNPVRAFHFHSGEDAETVVTGITIRRGYARGVAAAPGRYGVLTPVPYESIDLTDPNGVPRAERGRNSPVSFGYGGAILCEGASPTISKCVITECIVTGGQGGDGAHGQWAYVSPWVYLPPDPNEGLQQVDDGQWGGHAGDGYGNGYGGAIACLNGSSPTITECVIRDNIARGGRGGFGGDGGVGGYWPSFDQGHRGGSGDGGNGYGDGFGGGIYCDDTSTAFISDTQLINNMAIQGWAGTPGALGLLGIAYTIPDDPPPQPVDGVVGMEFASDITGAGEISGGAAYFGKNADPNLVNCDFIDNISGVTSSGTAAANTYRRGGGLYSGRYNWVYMKNCTFSGNLGGAVYCEPNSVVDAIGSLFERNNAQTDGGAIRIADGGLVDISDCSFASNVSGGDGGALSTQSDATITNTSFTSNQAGRDGGAVCGRCDTIADACQVPTIELEFDNCFFVENTTGQWGGALRLKNFTATATNSYFASNVAVSGGAVFIGQGTLHLTDGFVSGNRATGGDGVDIGGAIACADANAVIENCTIQKNSVSGTYPTGGAIAFYGSVETARVKNCLLTDNSSGHAGGAISCEIHAYPEIRNCTFNRNSADSWGGAVYCEWTSAVKVFDSIFTECNSVAILEQGTADATVEHSLFFGNPDGDYGLYVAETGSLQVFAGTELDPTNIVADPVFVEGPLGVYYLDQAASPAVDAGSETAVNLGLNTFTTDPAGSTDSGVVDLGWHYKDVVGRPTFSLTISVVGNHGGTLEIVEPQALDYNPVTGAYTYYSGTLVTLKATPDPSYRIKAWSGTINDTRLTRATG